MAATLLRILMTALALNSVNCLEIQSLRLEGGRGEFLDVNSDHSYTLSCIYRSGYDDPVSKVTWYLYGNKVYEWITASDDISASGLLLDRVDTSPDTEPGSLHFKKLDYMLAGNYTCQVSSASKKVEKTYYLNVIDISSVPYETSVQILKSLNSDLVNAEDNKYITYDVESNPTNVDDVHFEDAQCTLVWSFKSPAIFPKPNVTCGYYSFNHDDVIQYLPAGLTMHKFMNGSWQASFDSTRVQVSSIPMDHRLGCSVKIPETSYREMVMTKDDFTVDNLIDSHGCPGLDDVTSFKGLMVEPRDSTINCRGNLLPNNREAPAVVKLSCPYNHDALFPDGAIETSWWTELSCYEYDQQWRSYHPDQQQGELVDLRELPHCDRGFNKAHGINNDIIVIPLGLIFLFLVPLLNH